MTLREEIETADHDFLEAIRREIPDAEPERIDAILERLMDEYREKQIRIVAEHHNSSPPDA